MFRKRDLNKVVSMLEDIQSEGIKINRDDELTKVLNDIKGLRTAIYLQTCSGLGYLVNGEFYKSEQDFIEKMNEVSEGIDSDDFLDELSTRFENVDTYISTEYLMDFLGRIIDENIK